MLAAVLTALAILTCADGNDTERVLSAVNAAYSPVTAISCDYSYSKTVSLLEEDVKASGHVSVDRVSGQLEWTRSKPFVSTLIFGPSDVQGTSVTKENRQIYKKISKFIESRVRSSEIADLKEFNIDASETSREYVLVMTPKSGDMPALFVRMILTFRKDDMILSTIKMEDQYGDTTVIMLSSVKLTR